MYLSTVGYSSTAIFGNDLASDVRATYRELLEDGVSAEEALLKVEEEFSYASNDPDNRAAFWTALAATQMQLGRLDDRVRDQTIAVIDSGGDLHMWESTDAARRKAVFAKLRSQLLGPQSQLGWRGPAKSSVWTTDAGGRRLASSVASRVFPAPPQPSMATSLVVRPASAERMRYAMSSTFKSLESSMTRAVAEIAGGEHLGAGCPNDYESGG